MKCLQCNLAFWCSPFCLGAPATAPWAPPLFSPSLLHFWWGERLDVLLETEAPAVKGLQSLRVWLVVHVLEQLYKLTTLFSMTRTGYWTWLCLTFQRPELPLQCRCHSRCCYCGAALGCPSSLPLTTIVLVLVILIVRPQCLVARWF